MAFDDLSSRHYTAFCEFLEGACGIVLGPNKQYLVKSRLSPLVGELSYASISDFIDSVIKGERNATRSAIEVMTTNETLWFRDSYPYTLLEQEIFPALAKQNRQIKVWSAACSSGQEPYSIGMSWLNAKQKNTLGNTARLQVTGTDISAEMLDICRKGEYDLLAIARGLPEHCQKNYFEPIDKGRLRVAPPLKQLIQFKPINLLDSYGSLGKFDLVFCRNVLIYFSRDVKKQILQKIAACLQDDGILFLGASESLSGLSEDFTMIRSNHGLYYRKSAS